MCVKENCIAHIWLVLRFWSLFVHVCVSVRRGFTSHGRTVGRIYPWETTTMPQKYVNMPSYLCRECTEGTECWKGSANFRVVLFFPIFASKPSGCLCLVVIKCITKALFTKPLANPRLHLELNGVKRARYFEVWGFLLPNKLIYFSGFKVYGNFQ